MPQSSPPLSSVLPPVICGTATFNTQFNADPYKMPTTAIVHHAMSSGIRAFDTSPYYGPSEELLGKALDTDYVRDNFPRQDYFILTKVGRVASAEFDYSAKWVCSSVKRSLERLSTDYLDVVYCHDVEFVSPEEVLEAITELRRLRDEEGAVKYVGICGYPVIVLCDLAKMILEKTGEPLDIVQSYANFTLQNTLLGSAGVARAKAAKVDVLTNASMLGMGLLRRDGVPAGGQGDWHPASKDLRLACREVSNFCDAHGVKLETLALRYAMENWVRKGSALGSLGDPASGVPWRREDVAKSDGPRLGVSVMGCSSQEELDETLRLWRSVLDGLEDGEKTAAAAGRWEGDHEWSLLKRKETDLLARGINEVFGKWKDFAWHSPDPGFVNQRKNSKV